MPQQGLHADLAARLRGKRQELTLGRQTLSAAPNPHQRKAQEIEPRPEIRVIHPLVVLSEANPPNAVHWTGLDEYAGPGFLEKLTQLRVLRELGLIGANHNGEPDLQPDRLIETTDLPPQCLGRARIRRMKHLCPRFLIPKQGCLLGHHEVLRSGVVLTIHDEWSAIPLAEARGRDSALAVLVAPEEDVLQPLTAVEARAKVFEKLSVVHWFSSVFGVGVSIRCRYQRLPCG